MKVEDFKVGDKVRYLGKHSAEVILVSHCVFIRLEGSSSVVCIQRGDFAMKPEILVHKGF